MPTNEVSGSFFSEEQPENLQGEQQKHEKEEEVGNNHVNFLLKNSLFFCYFLFYHL